MGRVKGQGKDDYYNCIFGMKKQIFAVVPVGKKMEDGKAVYGVQLRLSGLEQTQQIWKPLSDYYSLEKQIAEIAFDFDRILEQQLHKTSTDEQKLKILTDFINQCKSRPDITNLITFREFFALDQVEMEHLDQWNRVNVGVKDMVVVGCAWDAKLGILFTLHRPHSKAKIITNFIKELLSKETQLGILRLHRLTNKWTPLNEITLDSEPSTLRWSAKSSMLFISTAIGIYIYTVRKEAENMKLQLIDFAKVLNPQDFRYCSKSASLYIVTPEKIYLHSINKEYTMAVAFGGDKNIRYTALEINRNESRLYVSQFQDLKIYDIAWTEARMVKELASISINDSYSKIYSYDDKFLFGISKAGYINVFEVKPPGKERLMSVLTSIDCPADVVVFGFHEKGQMIITSKGQYVVLISTKNVPLFAGGNHKQPITAGLFDYESNMIITADLDGNVIFYNISFKAGGSYE